MTTFKCLITALSVLLITGCLESETDSQVVVAGISGNPPTGELAVALRNGNSKSDYSDFWHCGPPDTVGSYDIMFGADASGLFKFFNDQLHEITWDVQNGEILFALDEFAALTSYKNIQFDGAHQFSAEFFIDNQLAEISTCRRTDLNNNLIEDDSILTASFSNGASATDFDDVWQCDTSSGIRIGLLLFDDGTGGFADSTEQNNAVEIESWTQTAQTVQMQFEDGQPGSIVDATFQDNNNFTATAMTRGTGSYGFSTCRRLDLDGNPIQARPQQLDRTLNSTLVSTLLNAVSF
ncbi:MAG: hypothetical protein KTR35_04985 [Gammaproteobacteria bacterium]|nr:hypothetical protein [Gammaproteobacteria bacterium]